MTVEFGTKVRGDISERRLRQGFAATQAGRNYSQVSDLLMSGVAEEPLDDDLVRMVAIRVHTYLFYICSLLLTSHKFMEDFLVALMM